jgi:hypothetical protein
MRDSWEKIDSYLKAKGFSVGTPDPKQTIQGHHASKHGHLSSHYLGLARDYGIHDSDANGIARHLEFIATLPCGPIAELYFAPLGIWYKNGQKVLDGPLVIGGHQDHCHVALHPGRWLL